MHYADVRVPPTSTTMSTSATDNAAMSAVRLYGGAGAHDHAAAGQIIHRRHDQGPRSALQLTED
jgi:hypothetical protein